MQPPDGQADGAWNRARYVGIASWTRDAAWAGSACLDSRVPSEGSALRGQRARPYQYLRGFLKSISVSEIL